MGTAAFTISTVSAQEGQVGSDASESKQAATQEENQRPDTASADPKRQSNDSHGLAAPEKGKGRADEVPITLPEVLPADANRSNQNPEKTSGKAGVKDPITMFGILTPQALRTAQSESSKMVEDIIPRIVSVDKRMKEIEIKIRRARKQRAKAQSSSSVVLQKEGRREALLAK